nr:EOG090X08O3 [Triops cancriformis]
MEEPLPVRTRESGFAGDEAVRATNDDASGCKRFAVELGYWQDQFLPYFIRNLERKAPEINRGYYARVRGLKLLIDQFIKTCQGNCQIVNLGAGFDTLYWKLCEEGQVILNFAELDFPAVTARKSHLIQRSKRLLHYINKADDEVKVNTNSLHAANYHIAAVDLRNTEEVAQKLAECNIKPEIPALFISECVLVYMKPKESQALLEFIASRFTTAAFCNYEQVNMKDRFGEVMLTNLKMRGCDLAGVDLCQDLKTQQQRLTQHGWEHAQAWNMSQVYYALPRNDVARIERLEFLDELELLEQLLQHYCICFAYKDPLKLGLNSISL